MGRKLTAESMTALMVFASDHMFVISGQEDNGLRMILMPPPGGAPNQRQNFMAGISKEEHPEK